MRTLSILLCSLLVFAPAKGQQAPRRNAPSFYVPYGVRNLPVGPIEEESSSEVHYAEPDAVRGMLPSAPMHRGYRMRRPRRLRQYGAGYGQMEEPDVSTTGALVIRGTVLLVVGWAVAQQ